MSHFIAFLGRRVHFVRFCRVVFAFLEENVLYASRFSS